MKKVMGFLVFTALISFLGLFAPEAKAGPVVITILSESKVCNVKGLVGERGFSVLIEKDGKQYLYDTGRDDACIHNAAALGKDITKTDMIFLSHGHVDHTGGLENVIKAIGHPVMIVCHPDVFSKKYALWSNGAKSYIGIPFEAEHFTRMHKENINFQTGFYMAAKGVWLTGEVPRLNKEEVIPKESFVLVDGKFKKDTLLDDNALILDTDKGLVVITGCGHSGIINILNYVKKNLDKNIYAVIGGMHLEGVDRKHFQFVESELTRIFKEEHTQVFVPNHCTGKRAIAEFRVDFPDIIKDGSCGRSFEF